LPNLKGISNQYLKLKVQNLISGLRSTGDLAQAIGKAVQKGKILDLLNLSQANDDDSDEFSQSIMEESDQALPVIFRDQSAESMDDIQVKNVGISSGGLHSRAVHTREVRDVRGRSRETDGDGHQHSGRGNTGYDSDEVHIEKEIIRIRKETMGMKDR
jgi:hypothetical protein